MPLTYPLLRKREGGDQGERKRKIREHNGDSSLPKRHMDRLDRSASNGKMEECNLKVKSLEKSGKQDAIKKMDARESAMRGRGGNTAVVEVC